MPDLEIKKLERSISSRGISNKPVDILEYTIITTFIHSNIDGALAIAKRSCTAYLINRFKANILFETVILCLYSIDYSFQINIILIGK